ncbi:DUF3530 family protein [Saccharobesus litoralis]|nr:DUF3530 family protein [Saccharobesus litoralis]
MKARNNLSWLAVLVLISITYCLSASLAAEQKLILPTAKTQLLSQDLKRFGDSDEVKELVAGDSTFVALVSEQDTSFTRGVAILMADSSLSQMQTQAYGHLRYSLNAHGWVTIAAGAPEPYHEQGRINDSNRETYLQSAYQSAEFISAEGQTQQKQKLQIRMQALLNMAGDYPGIIMVVAQGATAGFLTELYHAQTLSEPEIFVLVQPYLADYKANKALPKKIAELQTPILDIWSDYDNPWAKATVASRKRYARKLLTMHYRQRQLFGDRGWEQRDARLTKEIVGYIAYLGW